MDLPTVAASASQLARYLCPDLPVCIFSLSRSTRLYLLAQSAEHTKRSVKLYFDHADAEAGVGFKPGSHSFSPTSPRGVEQVTRQATVLRSHVLIGRWCAECVLSPTNRAASGAITLATPMIDGVKMTELADPETHWIEIALVAFTQTLSVGVDPKEIQFAAVFLYVFFSFFPKDPPFFFRLRRGRALFIARGSSVCGRCNQRPRPSCVHAGGASHPKTGREGVCALFELKHNFKKHKFRVCPRSVFLPQTYDRPR